MHIDDFPSELLVLILRQVYWYSPHRLKQWKMAIPSMAVCRKWRAIVLHHVHKHIIVEPKPHYSYVELFSSNLVPSLRTSVKLVESTLDILPANTTIQSKRLILNIDYKVGYVKLIRFAILLLQDYRAYISNTTHMIICNIGGVFANSRAQYHFGDSISEVRSLANTLVHLCPNIKTLRFSGMGNHIILSTFAQTVVLRYKQQLTVISASTECIVLAPDSFRNITSLDLERSSRSWDYLPIQSTSLKQLTISRYSDGFCWNSFEAENTSGLITFENLQNLTINMHFECGIPEMSDDPVVWLGPKDKIKHKILAPKLKTIDVELCPFACSMLASIVCLDPLDKLTIRIPCGIRLEFYGFDLSCSSRSIFLAHAENTTGIVNDTEFLNDILNIPLPGTLVSMQTSYPQYLPFGNHANCNNVGSLTIINRIELVDVLRILGQMRNLVSINARWTCIGSDYTDENYSRRVHDFLKLLSQPLSTSVKHITMRFMPYDVPNSLHDLLVSDMYEFIPSLASLTFDNKR